MELLVYDWMIRHQPGPSGEDPRVVLLTITEEDIQEYGYPIPDGVLARAIEELAQFHPRGTGLDIYRDLEVPPGHEQFEKALTTYPVVVVRKVGGDGTAGIPAPPVLQGSGQVGANDLVMDSGGIVRRALLFLDDGETTLFTFPLRLALLYLAAENIGPQAGEPDPNELRLGPTTLHRFHGNDGGYANADEAGYQILRDYQSSHRRYHEFPLRALLHHQVDGAQIRHRVVLIGITAESVPDISHTPYHTGLDAPPPTPGVFLHAQLVGQLLRAALEQSPSIRTAPDRYEIVWITLWGIAGGVIALWVQSPWRFSVTAAGGLSLIVSAGLLTFARGWWIPVAPPVLAWVTALGGMTAYLSHEERKQRAFVMQLFSPYVGPQIVKQLISDTEKARLGLRLRREVSLLFCDIVGFVKFCEAHTVDEIVTQMNEYLGAMTEVVFHWDGTLIDFKGDEVYALWGAPLEQPDHVERAVKCGIHMRRRLAELNAKWAAEGKPQLQNGVGINTGNVLFANMGAEGKRMKFEAVGDPVNLASRVEGLTRKFGAPIMITEFTAAVVKKLIVNDESDGNRGRLAHVLLRKVASVKVKGREEPVVVYELKPLERHEPSCIEEPEHIEVLVMTEK